MGELKAGAVYERLRDDLVAGAFAPGSRLSENQIGARYGVSRTPVREAMTRLEHDGLLARLGSTVVVPAPNVEQILDLFDARTTIEASLAACAAHRHREADLVVLGAAADLARALGPDASPAERFSANRTFHRALSDAAHNHVLADLQRQLDLRVAALRATTLTMPGRWATAIDQHEQLVVAVTASDAEAAASIAGRHLRDARDLWLDLIRAGAVPGTR